MKKLITMILSAFMLVGCSSPTSSTTEQGMKAGTYEGTGAGFHGDIKVSVTVDSTSITSIEVTKESETETIGHAALPKLIEEATTNQTYQPDTVSGASVTSQGFSDAVKDALTKAGADLNLFEAKNATSTAKETKEESYDIAVVGAGGAGLSAALTALQQDKTVVLFEKTGLVGGASAMAGAGTVATGSKLQKETGMEDSPEALKADMLANGHNKNDVGTLDIFVNSVGEAIDWLTDENGGNIEYEKEDEPTRTFSAVGRGAAVTSKLSEEFTDQGGILYVNTTVTELIVEDGMVTGVKAEGSDSDFVIHASSVILATGGFGNNDEMVPEEYKSFVYAGHAGATGDGIKMAEVVDADTINMDLVNVQPNSMILPSGLGQYTNPGVGSAYRSSGAFLVNQDAVRFANETGSSYDLKNAQAENDRQYLICDQTSFDAFNKGMENSKIYSEDDVNEWLENNGSSNPVFVKADTIEELADTLSLDAETLKKTVETYNATVGTTDEFGREINLAISTDGPFYAIQLFNRYYATLGGLHIDSDMHVLNTNQEVIDGLYAAGEVVGGLEGDIYYPGSLFSWAITSGHNAGLSASK